MFPFDPPPPPENTTKTKIFRFFFNERGFEKG